MKRDMEIIRSILLAIEENIDSSIIDGATEQQVKYHKGLLVEAGLVDGKIISYMSNATEIPDAVHINKLTWNGHEFIDLIKQKEIWSTIKTEFKDASFGTVLKVAKDLAEGWANKKVQALINS